MAEKVGPSYNDFPHVFTPVKIGPITLKNRIQFSPVVSAHASLFEGYVTDGLIEFIGAEAKSGVGLVTIGSSPINFREGRDFLGCLSVTRDGDIFQLKHLTAEAHRYGAKISAELIHAGRAGRQKSCDPERGALVPSIVPDLAPEKKFSEVTVEELQSIKQDFVDAAVRLKKANFDMIMIHGAHGNMMSALFSPRFNKRTDQYGGSLENRMRFQLEVLHAIREAVGYDIAIEYRVSTYEYLPDSPTMDDLIAFFKEAQKYIDIVHCSAGLLSDKIIARYMMPGYPVERCLNVERAAQLRAALDIPVTVVGNIPNMETAEQIIAEGKADVVAMARNILADMDYVNKAKRNDVKHIRPCLHCCSCATTPGMGGHVRCAVNPQLGRELRYKNIFKTETPKKVMIVGGGPAGMQAAQIAAMRGHDVTLYEASDKLGGRMYEASAMYCKDYFRWYLDWDIMTVNESNAKVVLNTKVDADLVLKENPDVLIIAVGGVHFYPNIEGIDGPNVINVSECDLREKPIGKKVVFCGGGLSAVEAAVDLAHEGGHEVYILERSARADQMMDCANEIKSALNNLIDKYGVNYLDCCTVQKIGENEVQYTDKDGNAQTIEADTIVSAFGMRPNQAMVDELIDLVPDCFVIGDALKVRNIQGANLDGFDVTVEL